MKDSTTTIKVVCAIIFILFSYTYFYNVQGDLLGMAQHAWSDGKTHYYRPVGAVILTTTLTLLSLFVMLFTRHMPQRFFAINFFPAMLAMGAITSVSMTGTAVTLSTVWTTISIILLITFGIFVNASSMYRPFMIPLRSTSFLSQVWWTNISCMLCMMVLVFVMGNTDRSLHTRLAVERLCYQEKWQEALEYGFPQYDNDSSLTMLRAMALARQNRLGEGLFRYDITGSSQTLFPQPDHSTAFMLSNGYALWQTIGKVPYSLHEKVTTILQRELQREAQDTVTQDTLHRIHRLRPVAKDYLLCAYLLDKDLRSFATTLPRYYTINDSLPQHYKEALLIYNNVYHKTDTLPKGALSADYADFLNLMRSNRNKTVQHSKLRDNYFGTYWYYYYMRNNCK